ncbi:hypothetical protein MTsPCn9_06870 [Croceitalea sp. MTPC9]|nr:hypothetical protein MTsPCn6_01840 [Croceitalea sp. MTPC6]GMN15751.1 hypothetical protein MTsPCn9_06870 [Croceitalea sp. MTPC9]
MENQNNENTAYVNFINKLNEILTDYDITQMNCS